MAQEEPKSMERNGTERHWMATRKHTEAHGSTRKHTEDARAVWQPEDRLPTINQPAWQPTEAINQINADVADQCDVSIFALTL